LPDGSFVLRIGATYDDGAVVHVKDYAVKSVDGVDLFGQCPNKRYFVMAKFSPEGDPNISGKIWITEGWQALRVAEFEWPSAQAGVPDGWAVEEEEPVSCDHLIAFPCGQKVLFIGVEGIFVLSSGETDRLTPLPESLTERIE